MRPLFVIACLFVSGAVRAETPASSSLPTCAWGGRQISSLQRLEPAACFGSGTVFLRENVLPICDWGEDSARSYLQLIQTLDGQPGVWECVNLMFGTACKIQDGRPKDFIYWLLGPPTMAWANGATLYGVRDLACIRTTAAVDALREQSVVGQLDVPDDCGGVPAHAVALTEIDGGVVEHVRPATVRGQVLLRVDNDSPQGRSVTLVIQVFSNGAWVDHATTQFAGTGALALREVQDQVSPGMDVRLQVRGTTCEDGFVHGYVIADARIQVETCIPDQSNPGSCL